MRSKDRRNAERRTRRQRKAHKTSVHRDTQTGKCYAKCDLCGVLEGSRCDFSSGAIWAGKRHERVASVDER